MACIVFSVDETLSRRPVVSNDRVADFAESNSDLAPAFGSFNPRRGPEAVAEARGLVASGKDSRLEISSALAAIFAQRPGRLSALGSICGSPPPGHLSYRTQRNWQWHAGRRRRALEVWQSYAVDFPDMPIIMAHPAFPWQDEAISICLHKPEVWDRSIRMVAEILFAHPGAIRQYAAETQSPVWFRLSPDSSRPLVIGFRPNRHPGRGTSLDFERECREVVSFEWNGGRVVRLTRIERVSRHDQAAENCWVRKEWGGVQPHLCHR